MRHCTVCGADAREGAKFCTSCGARLVDSVSTAPEPDDTAAGIAAEPDPEPNDVDAPAEPGDDRPDIESTWAPAATDGTDDEVGSLPVEPAAPGHTASDSPEYTASWPTTEDRATGDTDDGGSDEPPTQAGDTWTSWASVDAPAAPAPPATDADQDLESRIGGEDASAPTDQGAPASFETDADRAPASQTPADPDAGEATDTADVGTGMEASHQGASEWESWAPVATGEATVPASTGDTAASVRRLLDDLATRIDRLIAPADIGGRGVDADELADQLERWSHASQGSAGLLEVIQAVRKSPRDLDAIARLADRAPDLELLVRHYAAITSGAGDWARRLREPSASDDAS